MLKYIRFLIFLFPLFLLLNICFAQPPCNGPGCDEDIDNVPLTGIEWLIGAGVLWGVRSISQKRKNTK